MRCHAAVALGCILLASQEPLALSQSPAPQASETTVLSARSTLVLVPALVRNKAGELIFTLNADDFVVTDDGVPQKLTLEQDMGGEPLALVVVVEIGGAGARAFEKLGALAPMLGSVIGNVPHRIAVVAFDSQPELVRNFTPNVDAAAAAILDLTPGCSRQHHMENCEAPGSVHDVGLGDNGAAILDSLGFAVDLLRKQPSEYRRAILLVSETLDRGSHLKLDEALRAISDSNTAIYSIGFSTGKSEAAHYAARELPTQPSEPGGSWLSLANHTPNPPHGCMGTDPDADPDATHNKAVQAYDCLTQLAPPLALAKMAAIAATDGLRRNIPETVARLTGGEYFKLTDAKSLERSLATISNHMPNRYVLSFQPQSAHPGLHIIGLHLQNYSNLGVTARSSYWADSEAVPPNQPSIPR
jgi:VWFA-related protein